MKATLVPDLLTRCDAPTYLRAIRSGLETLSGRTPSNAHVAVLTAQSALESGRWRSMHRFNPGNIKASATYEYLYCQFRCNEVLQKKDAAGKPIFDKQGKPVMVTVWFDPPHPQTNFRAFMDLDTGVIDYLRFLADRARYRPAWEAAASGDPARFVHALKVAGYFTADEAPYLRSVVSLFHEYSALLNQYDVAPAPDDEHEAAVSIITPDEERLIHNTAVLNSFVDREYDRIHNDPGVWNPPKGD